VAAGGRRPDFIKLLANVDAAEPIPWTAHNARQGKRQNTYESLARIYGWFMEGFDTRDLQDAKSLLAELR
jgi:hypothetical protein